MDDIETPAPADPREDAQPHPDEVVLRGLLGLLQEKADTLRAMAREHDNPKEQSRIAAKATGVSLAASFVHDAIRGAIGQPLPVPDPGDTRVVRLRGAADRLTAAGLAMGPLVEETDPDARAAWLTAIGVLRLRVQDVLARPEVVQPLPVRYERVEGAWLHPQHGLLSTEGAPAGVDVGRDCTPLFQPVLVEPPSPGEGYRWPTDAEEAGAAAEAKVLERNMDGIPHGPGGWHPNGLLPDHVRRSYLLRSYRIPEDWWPHLDNRVEEADE